MIGDMVLMPCRKGKSKVLGGGGLGEEGGGGCVGYVYVTSSIYFLPVTDLQLCMKLQRWQELADVCI